MIFEEDNSQDITSGDNSLGKSMMGRSVKYGEAFKKSTVKRRQTSLDESRQINIGSKEQI